MSCQEVWRAFSNGFLRYRSAAAATRRNELVEQAGAGSKDAQAEVRRHAGEYTATLRQHIWKEDNVLFPMAKQVLEPPAAEAMLARFRDQSNPRTASALRARFEAFAAGL